jgi:hypothetical protein
LEQIRTSSSSTAINTSDAATETTLAALLAAVPADPATETTLAAMRAHTAQLTADTDTIITNNAANAAALLEDTTQLQTNTDLMITNNAANAAAIIAAIEACCDESSCVEPQANHCQRVQWVMDELINFAEQEGQRKEDSLAPYDEAGLVATFNARLGVEPTGDDRSILYTTYAALDEDTGGLCSSGSLNNQFHKLDAMLRDNRDTFINALHAAADSCAALTAWSNTVDAQTTDCNEIKLFGKRLLWQAAFDALYGGTIPTDPADLSSYDNNYCGAA